jgi:Mor family transcriptional regulator
MGNRAFNTLRNREMFAAFESGAPVAELANKHGLAEKTVRALLASERNRQLSSPDQYYQAQRNADGAS